jgi:hypothetical protein
VSSEYVDRGERAPSFRDTSRCAARYTRQVQIAENA